MFGNNTDLIVKHNKLIEANYKLTLQEQKIILILASQINKDDENFRSNIFKVEDLAKILNLKTKSFYSDLKNLTERLLSRVIKIKEPDGLLQISWLSSAKYYDNEGKVELSFDKKLTPYLLQLKTHFTKLSLKKLINLESIYAVRIYEICKQYENMGQIIITIKELKEILQIKDKKSYKLYSNIKLRVLLVAQKEINEKTDLKIDFEEIKTGRKITGLKFIIKNQNEINIKQVEEELQENQPQIPVLSVDTDLEEILAHIPASYLKDDQNELNELIKNAFESFDKEYILAQIEYTKKRAPQKFGAYLTKSILSNYAKVENKKQKEKELEKKRIKEEFENLSEEEHNKITLSFYNTLSNEEKDHIKNTIKNVEFFKLLEKEDAIITFITSSWKDRLIKFYLGE